MASENSSRVLMRLGIGLLQGAVLAGLYLADKHKIFPATVPALFAPLLAVALFIPFIVSQALGNVRRTTLIVWGLAATAVVIGLTWYDVWHGWAYAHTPLLSTRIVVMLAVFLFVAHALVSCGDADGRVVARYPTLFDLAWKLGVQVAIVFCFVGTFWIMLWLGIALFDMIGFAGFGRFITDATVAIPLTTLAAAAALHATDTSAPLVRGVRGLALTLLSWLLPVVAAIALAFLVSLAVTGLQPLWATRTAAFLLISVVVVLVLLTNAAYQGGDAPPAHILRVAGTLAAVLLSFLVWIATYALWLRVTQYGWSDDRIIAAGCVAVAAMFALGYLIAAVLPGPWLKFIEHWNVYGTFFFLVVLFALATPIADPMRLSVADQMQRLQTGKVKPEVFDFGYLRENGGRFGKAALETLKNSPDKTIAERAKAALTVQAVLMAPVPLQTPADLAKRITVHPQGAKLPGSFLKQKWDWGTARNQCLQPSFGDWRCDAVVKDLGDGEPNIVLVYGDSAPNSFKQITVYRFEGGSWKLAGSFDGVVCKNEMADLLAGRFTAAEPRQRDLDFGARRLALAPDTDPHQTCP
jgi:hypothetical protein